MPSAGARPRGAGRTWIFDLDDTLHDASWRVYRVIDGTMNAYLEKHLGLSAAQADHLRRDYWLRYGATLVGLVRHHGIDTGHFLDATHAFMDAPDGVSLLRAERGLAALFARLPGRKLLLTNAPARYARRVVRHIGVARSLAGQYAIEHMRLHGRLAPKPSRAMLRRVLARERIVPARAVLVEDSRANLKAARSLGMSTVLVTGYTRRAAGIRKSRPPYVDLQVESIAQLLKNQGRLR